ncbi:MAG: hypothetical protein AAB225_20500 [Acidobacteriota bacterium]
MLRLLSWATRLNPAWLVLLVLVPRLIWPTFGLLDDGVMLDKAAALLDKPWASFTVMREFGRFMPLSRLYHVLVYGLCGASAVAFYLAQGMLLAVILATLVDFTRRCGGSKQQARLAAVLFVISPPIAENFLTLSKLEPLQAAALLLALCACVRLGASDSRSRTVALGVALFAALLAAFFTKETSAAILPVFCLWWLVFRLIPREEGFRMPRGTALTLVAISLLAFFAAFGVWWLSMAGLPPKGSYASLYSLDISRILVNVGHYMMVLPHGFPLTVALWVLAAWLLLERRLLQRRLLACLTVWMVCWLCILIPWQGIYYYHLLAFHVGNAVFGGIVLGQMLTTESGKQRTMPRWALIMIAATGIIQVLNAFSLARFQLTVDRVNRRAVQHIASLPRNSVVLLNLPEDFEYGIELRLQVQNQAGRRDIRIVPFRFQEVPPAQASSPYYVASLVALNLPTPITRFPIQVESSHAWNAAVDGYLGARDAATARIEESMLVTDIGLQRVLCALAGAASEQDVFYVPCRVFQRPLVDFRRFTFAWHIREYPAWAQVRPEPASFSPDGVWHFQLPAGGALDVASGKPGDLPVAGDWDGDGLHETGLYRPSENRWYLDKDLDGKADRSFELAGMKPSDLPVAGDWDGDGVSSPGYFRPEDATWHLFNTPRSAGEDLPVFRFGSPGQAPLTGDWNNTGRDSIGIFGPAQSRVWLSVKAVADSSIIEFPMPGNASLVAADWSGVGPDAVTPVINGRWDLRFANCICGPANAPAALSPGLPAGSYFAGRWKRIHAAPKEAK